MKVAIWAVSPSPHQQDFYAVLRAAGVDLRVCYFNELSAARRRLGWQQPEALPAGELMAPDVMSALSDMPDWRQRVHVLPGYSRLSSLHLAARLSQAGAPWVHWSENSQPSWRSILSWPLKKAYARLVNRSALGAFAVGDAAIRDFVRWGVAQEKIAHLFYAVNGVGRHEPADPTVAEFARGKLAFVFAGTINRNKGPVELVKAFAAAVNGRDDQSCLVIVGDGPRRADCERAAQRLAIEDRVLFRGVVPQNRVGAVMKCCNVAVLPSRYDGWGVVLNEAASAGLALVASNGVGGAEHLIEPGVNGFRVAKGNVESLAAALRAYVVDRQLAAAHGAAARETFEEFTPQRNAARFIAAIRSWAASSDARGAWAEPWRSPAAIHHVAREEAA